MRNQRLKAIEQRTRDLMGHCKGFENVAVIIIKIINKNKTGPSSFLFITYTI